MNTRKIFNQFKNGEVLTKEDAIALLNIPNHSQAFYELLSLADGYTREKFQGKGYIFGQIGINASKCSIDCKFCALSESHFRFEKESEKNFESIKEEVQAFVKEGAQEIFLMTTADYSMDKFLEHGAKVRKMLPAGMKLVANVGDFNLKVAKELKEVGFTGCYHICRLREGKDTKAKLETRLKTLEAIKEAGLELYYCVEPIGPEHSYEEIVEEIFRPRDYPVEVMAAMRRIPVPGTPLFEKGQISAVELAKIVATIVLCMRPSRAMGVHEPAPICLIAGSNQIYAEVGINPRDCMAETKGSRGFSVGDAAQMLEDASWKIEN